MELLSRAARAERRAGIGIVVCGRTLALHLQCHGAAPPVFTEPQRQAFSAAAFGRAAAAVLPAQSTYSTSSSVLFAQFALRHVDVQGRAKQAST